MSFARTYIPCTVLIFVLANSVIVTGREPSPSLPQSAAHQDNSAREDSNNRDPSEPIKVPIETPEPGVRLYGTASPFATWTHTDLSPDGQWLVGFQGTRMLVWDRKAARIAREFDVTAQGSVHGSRFSPTSNYFAVFVRHWIDLPDLSDSSSRSNSEAEEAVASLLAMQPKFQGQILVYDRNWRLVGEYDVSISFLQFPNGLCFSPEETAILINGTADDGRDVVTIIDLKDKIVRLPPQQLGAANWLSSQRVAWPRSRVTWDYRSDSTGRLPDDVLPDTYRALTISDNCDWLLVQKMNGKVLVQLSTKREIPLVGWRGYVYGHVSPDNRFFVGFDAGRPPRQALLFDLENEQEVARVEDWQIASLKFVQGEPMVHLTLVAIGAGTRARSLTMATVPLDEGFSAALRRAQTALPVTDKILFAGKDQWLVLANSWSWVNLYNGDLTGLGQTSRGISKVAANPTSEHLFTFGSPVDRNNNYTDLAVTSQSPQSNQGRQIFVVQPPTAITTFLRGLLGIESESEPKWSTTPQHLSVSHDGNELRIIHSETKTSADGLYTSRFQLTTWDIHRQKKTGTRELPSNSQTTNSRLHFNLSPDGKTYGLANGSRIWWGDTESGQLTNDVGLPGIATSLEFSPDNRFVAVGLVQAPWQTISRWPGDKNLSLAHDIAVIEIESGLIRFQKKKLEVVGFGFHPQSNQLYILDRNHQPNRKRLTFYKTETWEPAFQHETKHSEPLAVALSSDGRLVAMPLADTRVEVWELDKLEKDKK